MLRPMADYFEGTTTLPPSFGGDHWMYAASVFGLMTCVLLTLEWLWRLGWGIVEQRRPFKHPVTISRLMLVLILIGILLRAAPDLALIMLWPEIAPETRAWIAAVDRSMDGISAIPMFLAWLLSILGGAMIDWQLARMPVPLHLWPTWKQMRRPLRIGFIVLSIALAITFLR